MSKDAQNKEERPAHSPDDWHTPANYVTLVRIFLVPVFVVVLLVPWTNWVFIPDAANPALNVLDSYKPWIAALFFALISCTDGIDGYLARSRNEVTTFGKFLDPLADKILVVTALLALIELGDLPSWPVIIIIAREFIISGVRMVAASEGRVIAASWWGKWKTGVTIVAILLFIVKRSDLIVSQGETFFWGFYLLSWSVMIAALVLTIVSMVDYLKKASFIFSASGPVTDGIPQDNRETAEDAAATADAAAAGNDREGQR